MTRVQITFNMMKLKVTPLAGIIHLVSRSTQFAMVLVLLLAAVFRLWMLPAFPLGLHYDEAANVILTRQIAEESYRPVFIRPYTGKEVLFFYASAPWIRFTGGQTWGVRLSAAMLGILTVAVTFAMTRVLLGQERKTQIALYAAAWMAVSFPHILLSRYGFRAITQPLLQGLAVTALWRGLRTKKTVWLITGGVLVGLTGYTYLAARLFPLPLAAAMAALWLKTPKQKRLQLTRSLTLILISAIISFAPLGLFFLRNPSAFGTRIAQVASSSVSEALRGIWTCIKALVLPGQGDPYVRFNQPGRPILDGLSALLACVGLVVFIRRKYTSMPAHAGRILILGTIAVMLLPSALATSEITPSNLRMVGVFPFLPLLPALGLSWLTNVFPGKHMHRLAAAFLFLMLGTFAGKTYALWSQSTALFYAADGEMALAAQAVEDEVGDEVTVFVASEHFQHPTVAALSSQYRQVKWLTGGSSFVLPPEGDVVRIVPISAQPPSPWSEIITTAISETWLYAPDGSPAVAVQHLTADDVVTLKQSDVLFGSTGPIADFAHITGVYDITPLENCESGSLCTISLVWEVLSPYPAMQPMIRINHPVTGEWSRAMPFHYPTVQWTTGDIILDQIQLDIPSSMPPDEKYQIAVSMVDTESQNRLPRLVDEQFAGLEYSVTASETAVWPAPPRTPLTESQMIKACAGIPRDESLDLGKLRLLGWLLPTIPATDAAAQVKPGELLLVTLCWEVLQDASQHKQVEVVLRAAEDAVILYQGVPSGGYGFEEWVTGTLIEDRYALRLPRKLAAGSYILQVRIDQDEPVDLAQVEVLEVNHTYVLPENVAITDAVFDSTIRLWGYDLDVQPPGAVVEITLYWQSLKHLEQDFAVFIHLIDPASGEIISQVDEQPLQGERATSTWLEGEVIADRHTLFVDDSLSSGLYTLRAGLYIPLSGTYMTVNGARELTLEIEIAQP